MGQGVTLVLGGIRSGKTSMAERRAAAAGHSVVYVATATAGDEEMANRIARHRTKRPPEWGLVEQPITLADALVDLGRDEMPSCALIDCMSLWLSNLMFAGEAVMARERERFLLELKRYPGPVIIVSNEVGLGTVGMDPLTRRFCDELGWLNQDLAELSDSVVMSVAGLPLVLK